jgi:hypothetical protein
MLQRPTAYRPRNEHVALHRNPQSDGYQRGEDVKGRQLRSARVFHVLFVPRAASIAPPTSNAASVWAKLPSDNNEGRMESLATQAIGNKYFGDFYYRDLLRTAEPHVYGITNGVRQVLVYQTRGQSSNGGLPNWRRFDLDRMSRLEILAQTFPGRRPTVKLNSTCSATGRTSAVAAESSVSVFRSNTTTVKQR